MGTGRRKEGRKEGESGWRVKVPVAGVPASSKARKALGSSWELRSRVILVIASIEPNRLTKVCVMRLSLKWKPPALLWSPWFFMQSQSIGRRPSIFGLRNNKDGWPNNKREVPAKAFSLCLLLHYMWSIKQPVGWSALLVVVSQAKDGRQPTGRPTLHRE